MARFDELEDEVAIRRPARWPVAVILLGVLGGGGWFFYRVSTAPDPLKVLVAVELDGHWYEGSVPAARFADELNQSLEELGFVPVRPGDPEVVAALEAADGDARRAARKLRAGYVVGGRVKLEVIEHPVQGGYFEVRADGDLEVFHVHDDAPEKVAVQAWSGARQKARAISLLADGSLALKATAQVIPPLLRHPVLAELLEGDAKTIGKLRQAKDYLDTRTQQLGTVEKAYPAYAQRRLDGEKGPAKVTYHGPFSGEDALAGTGPGGYLVKTEDVRPFVSPKKRDLRYFEALETLEWRTPEGEAKVLWSGYNVYSYPGASRDGRTVGLVEDLFGWAKTVTIITADGTSKRLKVDPDHRYSNLEPSPTGRYVALYDRECRRGCPDRISVLRVEDGAELMMADNEGGTFGGFGWLDDGRLAVLHTPGVVDLGDEDDDGAEDDGADEDGAGGEGDEPVAGEPAAPAAEGEAPTPAAPARRFDSVAQTLWAVPVEGGPAEPLLTVEEGVDLQWMSVGPDGKRVAFAARNPGGRGIAVFDIAGGALNLHLVDGNTSAPNWSPDGRRITFNLIPYDGRGSDEEIAVMSADGGDVTILTDNAHRDRYPRFSHDGQRIYYESLGKDPNFPRRGVAVIASVPADP